MPAKSWNIGIIGHINGAVEGLRGFFMQSEGFVYGGFIYLSFLLTSGILSFIMDITLSQANPSLKAEEMHGSVGGRSRSGRLSWPRYRKSQK